MSGDATPAGDGPDRSGDATSGDGTDRRDAATDAVDREAIVDRLDDVYDPELDRSIVDLEYVDEVRIDDGRVTVAFVLPTAWCSPAFAWMMATGIRDEVGGLPGVSEVDVQLRDHMHDEEINRGVNGGLAFHEAFEDADDDLDAVRRKLDHKARLVRQHDAVGHLLEAGLDPGQIVDLTPADLEGIDGGGFERGGDPGDGEGDELIVYLRDGAVGVPVPAEPVREYLAKAREVGIVDAADDPLFADVEGEPIAPEEFDAVRRETRLVKTNVSGQAGICSQLHEARNS